ncbi:MAG: YerC/YecD family TrpR-related protein [Gammaproteobacteria bacterium]|jgi:TrpR-related protein YerC/YecD
MKPNRELSARRAAQQEAALCDALVAMQDANEMRALLGDLCTPAELQALMDRWQVVRLLDEGLPYRRINELTGVSVTTIGRVARFLADGFGGYRLALDRIRTP